MDRVKSVKVGVNKVKPATFVLLAVGIILLVTEVLTVALDLAGAKADPSIVYIQHTLLGVFVLLVGGKFVAKDLNDG